MSRALLIARVAFFFFQRFSSEPRGQPGSIVGDQSSSTLSDKVCSSGPVRTLPAVYVSAVIDGGSHPFPFRTRKLSLLSPMVLGLRARESRSLQDSRPLGRKRPRGLFFYTARPECQCASTARPHSRDHARSIPGTCRSRPLPDVGGGIFLYTRDFLLFCTYDADSGS